MEDHDGEAVHRTRASVRRHVRIRRPAEAVWPYVGDPTRLAEWFTGIAECHVVGVTRTVVTESGVTMSEEIITNDPLARRFQYRITTALFREHLSTIDVIDLDDATCLAVYGVDANPATLALVIAGAAGDALARLRELVEAT
ncbi:MAG: SRPBCC family protein [Acidimicrobiales bacterium]